MSRRAVMRVVLAFVTTAGLGLGVPAAHADDAVTISGVVTGDDASPLAGVTVEISPAAGPYDDPVSDTTNAAGEYSIRVDAGHVLLTLANRESVEEIPRDFELHSDAVEVTTDVELDLELPVAQRSIQVRDEESGPSADAHVLLEGDATSPWFVEATPGLAFTSGSSYWRSGGVTGSNGVLSLPVLVTGGESTALVQPTESSGSAVQRFRYHPDHAATNYVVPDAVTAYGRVIGADGGTMSGVHVEFLDDGSSNPTLLPTEHGATTNAIGMYFLKVPKRPHTVAVEGQPLPGHTLGFNPLRSTPQTIAVQGLTVLDLTLPFGRESFQVVDENGDPLVGARVSTSALNDGGTLDVEAAPGLVLRGLRSFFSTGVTNTAGMTSMWVLDGPASGAVRPAGEDHGLPIQTPFSADAGSTMRIVVDGTTVTVESTLPSTTTSLVVHGSGATGCPVALDAMVTPNNAAGTVKYYDGSDLLGEAPLVDGTATLVVDTLEMGPHALTARFVPADPGEFATSSSSVTTYDVTTASTGSDVDVEVPNGALTLSVTGDGSVLLPASLAPDGSAFTATAQLDPVRVVDTRAGSLGWVASGQLSPFVQNGEPSIAAANLGWSPLVGSTSNTAMSVTAGPSVAAADAVAIGAGAGQGLSVLRTLATSPAGASVGTADLVAELTLRAPSSTLPGSHQAVLTLTVI